MTAERNSQKEEVLRLAGIANQAVARERSRRARLSMRGHRAAKTGLLVGSAAVAGMVLVSALRRREHHDSDDKAGEHRAAENRAGVFERTGEHLLSLLRWGITASHMWTLAVAPKPAPTAPEPVPDV